nr:hypothetical protein [uncultured Flavobacterium sp.]
MECLLISGAQSVGKSKTIYRLANHLVAIGYVVVAGAIPAKFTDFKAVLEGKNKQGQNIRIIINSPTDTIDLINNFKRFYDSNGHYEILISSVRDASFPVRKDFFRIMNIAAPKDFILELPLAKVTRQGTNFRICLTWYETQMDILVHHVLNSNPFNI